MELIRRKLRLARTLARLGPRPLAQAFLHRLRLRNGAYHRVSPGAQWSDAPEPVSLRLVFAVPDREAILQRMSDPDQAVYDGKRIAAGEVRFFSAEWCRVDAGWRTSPQTQYETPVAHWSSFADFNPAQGDIKWLWEASRFDWLYALARAHIADPAGAFDETFWRLLDDWRNQNPPNLSINWKCGQECSLRLIALVFATSAFSDSLTPTRAAKVAETVSWLARRVEAALPYALAQRNNHGLSESAALFLASTALPTDPHAARWREKGARLFERQVLNQFAEDGSYIQNSHVYTRLALRVSFAYLQAAEVAGHTVPDSVRRRLAAAINFLSSLIQPNGHVPLYGANDGANIMVLSGTDYHDFRPVVQLLGAALIGHRLHESGAHDEELAWFFANRDFPLTSPPNSAVHADKGGYYGMRSARSFGTWRCHTYGYRPSHADMLALDLWVDGINLIPDLGSYAYYNPNGKPIDLAVTAAHNTVEVGGESQMTPGSRFLWTEWTRSRVIQFSPESGHFSGEHYGYQKRFGIIHRRTFYLRGDDWLIVDDLIGNDSSPVPLVLTWHLADLAWTETGTGAVLSVEGITIEIFGDSDAPISLVHGESANPPAVASRFYGQMEPVWRLSAQRSASRARWITTIGRTRADVSDRTLHWHDLRLPLDVTPN